MKEIIVTVEDSSIKKLLKNFIDSSEKDNEEFLSNMTYQE
jgi:hypothetical protein